ncbi:MAG: hypothetical protein WHX93_16145 [bacterium]
MKGNPSTLWSFMGGLALGVAMCTVFFLGWPAWAQRAQTSQASSPQRSLVAEEIRLVDSQGRPRAKINASPGDEGVTLALYHKDGKHLTLYRLNPTGLPSISLVPLP